MQQPTDVGNVCCHVRRLQSVILAINWDEILLKREDEAFRNYISVGQKLYIPYCHYFAYSSQLINL